jgi:hypothetical protein
LIVTYIILTFDCLAVLYTAQVDRFAQYGAFYSATQQLGTRIRYVLTQIVMLVDCHVLYLHHNEERKCNGQ